MQTNLPSDAEVVAAYNNSASINSVAKQFGISWSAARNIVTRLGLTLPPPRKPRTSTYTAEDVREQYLSNKYPVESSVLRQLLISTGIKEARCEICGYEFWRGARIPLDLHHKNGDHYDNTEDNLMVLCPTCHALVTRPKDELKTDLVNTKPKGAPRPASEVKGKKFNCTATELLQLISTYGTYRKVGEFFGVTDNAIKKRCRVLGIIELVQPIINEHKRICALQNRKTPSEEKRAEMSAAAKKLWETKESPDAKPVDCLTLSGQFVQTFKSLGEASRAGFISAHIVSCCSGSRKTHRGYMWRYHIKEAAQETV